MTVGLSDATEARSVIGTVVPDTSGTAPWHARLGFLRERGMGASILVAALSSAFGVLLVGATGYIGSMLQADPLIGDSRVLAEVVRICGWVLLGVAIYVAGIVTANTFSTIVAGRVRRIALMRLIGATARSQRSEVAGQGLGVGVIGAAIGLAIGTALVVAGTPLVDALTGVTSGYQPVEAESLLPPAAVVLTTWAAAWIGSRRVLTVTPLQALAGSATRTHEEAASSTARNVAAILLLLAGAALLGAGVVMGLRDPNGLFIAFLGGLVSFTGLILGATLVMPPVLRVVGAAFGRGAVASLAARNALRYPERSSRMAIGVVMGVTLVTMFATASESARAVMFANADGHMLPALEQQLSLFTTVMMALVGVSAVIAAVGLVNLLTIGVVQRRAELGLLRALGLTGGQVRRMVLVEAAHITIASVALGLVLGGVYGWAGAQSMLGSVPTSPTAAGGGLVAPAMPWGPVVAVVAATAILTLVAAVTPTRLATRVAPVEALAEEAGA